MAECRRDWREDCHEFTHLSSWFAVGCLVAVVVPNTRVSDPFITAGFLASGSGVRLSPSASHPDTPIGHSNRDFVLPNYCFSRRLHTLAGLDFWKLLHRSEEHTSELQSPMYLV